MALLPLAAALLVSAPVPNAVTPEGPATLRASWLGLRAPIQYLPRVVVRWSVEVGEGGAAGPVALRAISDSVHQREARALARGPVEQLPAAPGTYTFPARLPFLSGNAIGIDQEAGRHAIVTQHSPTDAGPMADPYDLHALDAWRPPLETGATAGYDERIQGAQLAVELELEPDIDSDGYGDETQDANDLSISARAGRRAVRVLITNRGNRRVALPRVLVRMRGGRLEAPPPLRREWAKDVPAGYVAVEVASIPPRATLAVLLRSTRPGFRWRLTADSEGFDPTPTSTNVRGRSG